MAFRTVVVKNGEKLSLKLDNLVVRKSGNEYIIPLVDIENIILEGEHTVVTTRLLAQLSRYSIIVIICDNKFMPCGMYLNSGQYHRTAKRAMWQAQWKELDKLNAWTEIVTRKINNQIEVASYLDALPERLYLMEKFKDNILLGDESNREGHVAKVYFNSIYGIGFTREDNSLPNACMNYGYAIVRAEIARSVTALGLIPSLGIFHKNEYNAFNLVDDLMEPFRPLLDGYIHQVVLTMEEDYLTYEKRLKIIDFFKYKNNGRYKKYYMNNAMHDYVNSFIKSMETGNFNNLMRISFDKYLEANRK